MSYSFKDSQKHMDNLVKIANDFNPKNFCDDVAWFRKLLGEKWVLKRECKLKTNTSNIFPVFRLLAHANYRILEAKKILEAQENFTFEIDEHIIDLILLIRALKKLGNAKNFLKKIEQLKSNNIEKFNATYFELYTASSFVNGINFIDFIDESEEESPDIEITSLKYKFQIECKYSEIQRGQDITNYIKRIMKKASSQISKGIPGQLWCKFKKESDIEEAYILLEKIKYGIEISMNSNDSRNINRINIIIPCITKIYSKNKEGYAYSNLREVIHHPNPRTPFPKI